MEYQFFFHEKDEILRAFLQIYLQIPLRYHSELTLITEATPFNIMFSIEWLGDIPAYPEINTLILFLSKYGEILWVDHIDGGVYMAGYRKNDAAEAAYTKIPGATVAGVTISSALYRPSYSVDFYGRLVSHPTPHPVVKKEVIKPRMSMGSAWARPLKF
ncbi:MAG: hypothetical protein F2563_00530 [Actinobacteria bacterium]|nr:hypothetical protein [Actinomycetota bacterium]